MHSGFEKLATTTGQYIDLYGDASFSGRDLFELESFMTDAKAMVASQPEYWDVCTGQILVPWDKTTRKRSHLKEVVAAVNRSQFLIFFQSWEQVIERAKELQRPVVCLGD